MVLLVSGLAWLGFGCWIFACPDTLSGVGLSVEGPLGRAEIRAFYGGLELGLGSFLVWCAWDSTRHKVGLVGALLCVGLTCIGRVSGIAIEGFETAPIMWAFAGIEFTGALITAVAIAKLPGNPQQTPAQGQG